MAGGKAGKDSGKAKTNAVSRSQRAGLQFRREIQVPELADVHQRLKGKAIAPCHLQLAIGGDEALDSLLEGMIAGGGVIPHIANSGKKGQQKTVGMPGFLIISGL
ncbi:histone H2A.Z-like [Eulemur rufifrons]|uniref:histone H2A.Z-like n=1 Tax=Eulemur rufifrons TaxID=859984 RepID=UPI003743FFD7